MRIDTLSIFPEIISGALAFSIPAKAQERGLVEVRHHDLREYATDKHRKVDDIPYGGGVGMVFKPDVAAHAIRSLKTGATVVIHPSPAAPRLTQKDVTSLSKHRHLLLIASRYEGLDQRVIDRFVDLEFAVGDFVISGGELACAMIVDAVIRLLPGALGKEASYREDSFFQGLLDHPHYTRPPEFEGMAVPEVLQSGNHEKIRLWRKWQALTRTARFRPDLLEQAELDDEAHALLRDWKKERP